MMYLLSTHWLAVLAALVLGLIVGWRSCDRNARETDFGTTTTVMPFIWAFGALFLLGALIAVIRSIPGVGGYWFDVIMLLLAVYILGCILGCLLAPRRPVQGGGGVVRAEMPRVAAVPEWERRIKSDQGASVVEPVAVAKVPSQPVTMKPEVARVGFVPEWELRARSDEGQSQPATPTPPAQASVVPTPFPTAPVVWTANPPATAQPVFTAPPAPTPPAPVAAQEDDPSVVAEKPAGLAGPRGGKKDNLQRIRGIGRVNEGKLNALGIWHFDQIASWDMPQAKWVNTFLAFPGRIQREDWIAQAKVLATGADTAFSKRVDKGEVATSDNKKR
jgi:predicted flap endonuclease-1-like 5' DNA nuclease